jgi:hypothetical protein
MIKHLLKQLIMAKVALEVRYYQCDQFLHTRSNTNLNARVPLLGEYNNGTLVFKFANFKFSL